VTDEDVGQPLLVPFGGPAAVTEEQQVHLGGGECVNDVASVCHDCGGLPRQVCGQSRPGKPDDGKRAPGTRIWLIRW